MGRAGAGNLAGMELAEVLAILRAHEAELRARGVESLSVFGSVARGEAGPESDVDLAARLAPDAKMTSVDFHGVREFISRTLRSEIDLIAEPIAFRPSLQREVEADRAVAF